MNTNVNLAARSAEERAAIELDKQRWIEANSITDTKTPDEIRAWLLRQFDDEYREDMRRRLNVIRRTRLEIKNNVAGSNHKRRAGQK